MFLTRLMLLQALLSALLVWFILLVPSVTQAHPEAGFLPDAVAETEYKIVLELNPKDVATRNKLGIVLYRKNKLREAEKSFYEVLKMSPGNFDAHDGMGLVHIKDRKYDDAVSWFKKAIAITPDDTMVHYNMGFAFEQMGKLGEAETAYKRALEVNAAHMRKGVNREQETGKRAIIVTALAELSKKKKAGK